MLRNTITGLLGLLALAAAGCTGSNPNSDDASQDRAEALEFSECMRDNGITDFPDPQEGEGGGGLTLPEGMNADDPDFKAAEEACVEFMPGPDPEDLIDAEQYEALLDYTECMRDAGVANFPDPEEDGLFVHFDELGIDPDSDDYQAALDTCEDQRPDGGAIEDGA
jgi:hypothetical protein